jgi:dTDP-4-dehydrorhamnose reductase
MKPRILLIGKNGQIGVELQRLLPQLGKVIALGRQELDLSRSDDVRRMIRTVCPNLIINAAAYTAVDRAEKEEAIARAINADAPTVMAEEAKKIGSGLVHYSTDYVFDGLKNSPYEETDPTNPVNVYGKTKLIGEQGIQETGVPHLIFRTAWVYATRGRNFLLTILRLATQGGEELKIVSDQIGAPTWSHEITVATIQILTQLYGRSNGLASLREVAGIYHMTSVGETNWYEFARVILEEASRMPPSVPWFAAATGGRSLVARRVTPISTAEYPTAARRPAYSLLSNLRLTRTFGVHLPDWHTQLHSAFGDGHLAALPK